VIDRGTVGIDPGSASVAPWSSLRARSRSKQDTPRLVQARARRMSGVPDAVVAAQDQQVRGVGARRASAAGPGTPRHVTGPGASGNEPGSRSTVTSSASCQTCTTVSGSARNSAAVDAHRTAAPDAPAWRTPTTTGHSYSALVTCARRRHTHQAAPSTCRAESESIPERLSAVEQPTKNALGAATFGVLTSG